MHLEQLLTTGGGWQDQCGGLYGGIKISGCEKGLPVHITTKMIQMKPGFVDTLNQSLLLVYSGKTRLARNLLQVCMTQHSPPLGSSPVYATVYFFLRLLITLGSICPLPIHCHLLLLVAPPSHLPLCTFRMCCVTGTHGMPR